MNNQYKALNIVVIESSRFCREFLVNAIANKRPYHNIMVINNIEEIFTLLYEEVKIDAIFFDIESGLDVNNISIINTISPKIACIHWSSCQHPEIIELLHNLGVNSFCLKNSNASVLINIVDSVSTNPKILYVDEGLNQCLPLLPN